MRRRLAFIRIDGRACDIMLMPLRRARRSARRRASAGWRLRQSSKSRASAGRPNGDWLVESFAPGPDPIRGWQIARVSTATGVRETLTLPTPGTLGDYSPSVSPDGTRIAFVRGINGATSDIHVVSMSGGTPTRITWDNQDLVGVDWSADGQSLVYATDRAGGYTIWRVGIDGGDPQLVVGGAAKLKHPSVARTQRPRDLRELVLRDQPVGSADRRPARSRRRSVVDAAPCRADLGSVEPLAGSVSGREAARIRLDAIRAARSVGRRIVTARTPRQLTAIRPRLDARAAMVAGRQDDPDQRQP